MLRACIFGALLACCVNGPLSAAITLSTSDGPLITPLTNNQGWWSNTASNTNTNDSIFTGTLGGANLRSFFTFNVSSIAPGSIVNSAELLIQRGLSGPSNEPTEDIGFFDVVTSAAALNNNTGTNTAIWTDLGSGVSYGSFTVAGSGPTTDILSFTLNAGALVDIQAAIGAGATYFSIGASLLSNNGDDILFADSDPPPVRLNLDVTAVPEPSSLLLVGLLTASCVGYRRRQS